MSTTSLWIPTADIPTYPPLTSDADTEVCIVGAGIAGLTTAYLLNKAGRRVMVLDAIGVAAGESQNTTAHCTTAMDDLYVAIAQAHGDEGARRVARAQLGALDQIEAIVTDEGIRCGFARVDGYLIPGKRDSASDLDDEARAAQEAGLTDVMRLEGTPMPGFTETPAIRFPRQVRLHVPQYLAAIARLLTNAGVPIHGGTRVTSIDDDGRPAVQCATGATVRANAVVVATNSPISDRLTIHTKQAPYRTYVVGFEVPRGSVPDVLLWDTEDPYHYVRIAEASDLGPDVTHDVLLVGGEDHKSGETDDGDARFAELERWTRATIGTMVALPPGEARWRWSGQVQEPADFLGFAGEDPEHGAPVYIITGDSGQGITHGTIGAAIVSDLILGRPSAWTSLYDPTRKPIGSFAAAFEMAKENIDVAVRFVGDRLTADSADDAEPPPGSGTLVRRGMKVIARYCDDRGTIHERDAACTHLGCPVHWNSTEDCWDCPCHGSRFDPYGHVIAGPATRDLGDV